MRSEFPLTGRGRKADLARRGVSLLCCSIAVLFFLSTAAGSFAQEPRATPATKAAQGTTQLQRSVTFRTVPDVRGKTPSQANVELARLGLALGEQVIGGGRGTPGTIVAQDPPAGTKVAPGTKIKVTVVRAPSRQTDDVRPPAQSPLGGVRVRIPNPEARIATVGVPNVVGQRLVSAQQILQNAQLSVGSVTQVDSGRYAPDTVITQSPGPGAQVAVGSAVTMRVARAPAVQVPDVRGRTVSQAREILRGVQLQLGSATPQTTSVALPGLVIAQDRQPGTTVSPGSVVNVAVAVQPATPLPSSVVDSIPQPQQPKPLRVPNLLGQTVEQAKSSLSDTRFRLGDVSVGAFQGKNPGTIIGQTPAAGAEAEAGTRITVQLEPEHTIVPDVVGEPLMRAESDIGGARLRVGSVNRRESEEPAGTVISQNPEGESTVAPGRQVDLVVSTGLTIVVTLHPDSLNPAAGTPVKFHGRVEPELAGATYQFFFGDKTTSGRLSQPEAEHRYEMPTQRKAWMVVRAGGREYRSNVVLLDVAGIYAVTLGTDRERPDKGESVQFTATLNPPLAGAEYKFLFGDGTETEWTKNPVRVHVFPERENYRAYVIARAGSGPQVRSEAVEVQVQPLIPLWAIAAGVGALLAAVGAGVYFNKRPPVPSQWVSVAAHADAGRQKLEVVESDEAEESDAAVEIRVVQDTGAQVFEEIEGVPGRRRAAHE